MPVPRLSYSSTVMRSRKPAKWQDERSCFNTSFMVEETKIQFSTLLLDCFRGHFSYVFHTAMSPSGFCLSCLCVQGCFSGSSAQALLAVYALSDLLFVIIFRKGVPEEAEDLSHLPEAATDVLSDCHRQRPLPRCVALGKRDASSYYLYSMRPGPEDRSQ